MNDKLSEEYKESIKYSINTIKEFIKAIEKELERDMAYKSYIHEKIDGIEWRARMIKSICEEDE